MRTKSKSTRTRILALVGTGASQQEIASAVGVSRRTVYAVLRENREDVGDALDKLAKYQRSIGANLTLAYRARRLKELAQQNTQPMVALKALERADVIDGLGRPVEREGQRPVSLFELPPNTKVGIIISAKEG
jgi:transposase